MYRYLLVLLILKTLAGSAQSRWYEKIDTVPEQGVKGPITWKFIHERLDSSRWKLGISLYIDKGYKVYGPHQPDLIFGQGMVLFVAYPGDYPISKFYLNNPILVKGNKRVQRESSVDYKGNIFTASQEYYGSNNTTDSCRIEYIFTCSPYLARKAYLGIMFQWAGDGNYYPYREWYYRLEP